MKPPINKDTQLCMSLSGRPGNFGTRFHNHLYDALGLDFLYKAFTTTDLPAAIAGIRALGIRGCAVSMPFKEACIPYLDRLDASAAVLQSVNTIVNEGNVLHAYNTDYLAVRQLLTQHHVNPALRFALRGSGGMARAVAFALRDAGFTSGTILARNEAAGRALAHDLATQDSQFVWQPEHWQPQPEEAQLLINVTPIGMAGGPEAGALAFAPAQIAQAQAVMDVVASPAETPLIRAARTHGKPVITGAEVIELQALEQFVLYTGVRPSAEQVQAAAAFARP
ncbi:shikimate 5-dehydrogenase [Deinococcus sp. QL22]|uniref:shikimate 5-dehydrogenase n=1 Tax=Deinococcus sp. QL22 TaxID=2939437 RepID=UPI00201765F3|nr:shikimate 5-dehydrogenase [Deinococcus sp. QL22]UQN05633.1 shikimate 5-dehydrogenase [Deinococcus sp. QL22]